MKNRTVGDLKTPVISMAQARRMASQNPSMLVEQIGLLLNERMALKHERNVLRCLMHEITRLRTDKKETKAELLKRIQILGWKALLEKRKVKQHKEDNEKEGNEEEK